MSALPDEFIKSLQHVNGFDENAFKQVHLSDERITSIRINPKKVRSGNILSVDPTLSVIPSGSEGSATQIPWSSYGYYLPSRPSFTLDPLFTCWCILRTGTFKHVP